MFKQRVLYQIMLVQLLPFCLTYFNSLEGQTFFESPYSLSDAPTYYRDNNPITSIHECTHGINSMLRNRYGQQCFYVGNKRFVKFSKTGVRLSQVAQNVRYRGLSYNLYLVQQRSYWEDTGLYLMDEWVSYTNGAAVAVYERVGGQHWSDVQQACEFGHYTYVLVQLVPDTYTQKEELRKFWKWQAQRCVSIADTAEKTNTHYRTNIRPWREWLRARIGATSGTPPTRPGTSQTIKAG